MKKMHALMFYGPGKVKYEKIEIPSLGSDEVLVKVEIALSCGTDIKTYRRGHPTLINNVPSGFGHEFAGTIEKVGYKVKDFQVGQRVVAANSAPCMQCFYCKIKKYNMCENLNLLNGAYAEYIKIPSQIVKQNLLKIPDHVSFEKAAFIEPLATVVLGCERSEIEPGYTVGIIGLGPIGLMFVKLAKLAGARVVAIGRNPLKLKFAKEFGGADEVVNLKKTNNPEKTIMDLTPEGKGLDVIIEAVGLPEIWERVVNLTRKSGTVHLFGGCESGTKIQLDTRRIHYDEIKIVSTYHHTPKHIREALRLISEGLIEVEKLITHTMHISEFLEAVKLYEEGKAIKVALKPWLK